MLQGIPTYFRSIFVSLCKTVFVTTSLLVILVWVTQINTIIGLGANTSGLYLDILSTCLYLVPYIVFTTLPIGVFTSVMTLIYKYRKTMLVLALQNCGISPAKISFPFYCMALIAISFHYIIDFYVVPYSYHEFRSMQLVLKQNYMTNLIENGKMINSIHGFTIYVDEKIDDHNFRGIFISDNRKKTSDRIFTAKTAQLVQEDNEIMLTLYNGIYIQNGVDDAVNTLKFDSYSLTITLDHSMSNTSRRKEANEMTLSEMMQIDSISNANYDRIRASMHQRIVWPLFSLPLTWICLYVEWLYYYSEYRKNNTMKPFIITILVALIVICSNFILKSISVKLGTLGIVLTYFNAIFLLPIIVWVLKSSTEINMK